MTARTANAGSTTTVKGPPLARLFATAFRQLIDGLHERLASRGWSDVRPAYGFVLLSIRDSPTTGTDVAALLGVTKQAASVIIDSMVAARYVTRSIDIGDGRRRTITMTARGHRFLAAVEEIYVELEAEWATVIGPANVEKLRTDLAHVLRSTNSGELPPVRPTW